MVDDRAFQDPTESAGVVGTGLGESSIGGLVVGHDLVARRVVGLDEHGMARSSTKGITASTAEGACGSAS